MELALLVYGISVVHSLGFVLVLALVFSVIVFIGSGIGYIETYSDKGKVIALRWLKG